MKRKTMYLILCTFMILFLLSCETNVTRGLGFNHGEASIENHSTVNVSITTSDGGSVNGAIVRLVNNNGNPAHQYQQIATGSSLRFINVVRGTYTLIITLNGYQTFANNEVVVQSSTINYSAALSILPANSANVNIQINTDNAGSISGAIVRLVNNSNPALQHTQTVSANSAHFSNITFGTYTLTVTHNWYRTFTNESLTINTPTVNEAVTLSGLTSNVTIQLNTSNSGSVIGTVVRLVNNATAQQYQQIATSNTVNFTDIPYGIYTLHVTLSGYREYEDTALSVQTEVVSRNVTLAEILPDVYVVGTSRVGSDIVATL